VWGRARFREARCIITIASKKGSWQRRTASSRRARTWPTSRPTCARWCRRSSAALRSRSRSPWRCSCAPMIPASPARPTCSMYASSSASSLAAREGEIAVMHFLIANGDVMRFYQEIRLQLLLLIMPKSVSPILKGKE